MATLLERTLREFDSKKESCIWTAQTLLLDIWDSNFPITFATILKALRIKAETATDKNKKAILKSYDSFIKDAERLFHGDDLKLFYETLK